MSWGYAGHYKINESAALSFNGRMSQFRAWKNVLAGHGSDADDRKRYDESEGPKHYIDIDNYSEFLATGWISESYDSLGSLHGSAFVRDNGLLPWATLATFDTLKRCFEQGDLDRAVLVAADLGHYVGDGHMPLHICKNYNGQFTGNYGIHSRYESTMINAHIGDISYNGDSVSVIKDVASYIFGYLYKSYRYRDSVLMADDYATEITRFTDSVSYIDALWSRTGNFTIELFHDASHALAELIFTAWVEAGSPSMNSASDTDPHSLEKNKEQ